MLLLKRNKMLAEEYFRIMEETGSFTYKIIENYLDQIPEEGMRKLVNSFINGRLKNKRRLRSLLVRASYHILTNDSNSEGWKKAKNLYAFAELWCIADYLTNDVFDNKLDKCKMKLPEDKNLFFMASAVIRELSQKALNDAFDDFNTSLEARIEALNTFSDLVKDAYLHQWVDYTEKYNNETREELDKKLNEIYKKRYELYQAGNVFGHILKIFGLVINPEKKEEIKLIENYGKISSMLQIVNDIADIAENCYDARNKILSLPLTLTMIKTRKNVYELPTSEIRELFVKSSAFKECRKKAIREMKEAKKSLKELSQIIGKDNLGIKLLNGFLIMAWSNKYYKILRAYENDK